MAHSARSKSKLKSKAAKVNNSNSDYFKLSEARKERLAKKLKDNLELQKNKKAESKNEGENENHDENAMALDDEKTSSNTENKVDFNKISTSGWRTSRKAVYKKKKASKNKNKTMKF